MKPALFAITLGYTVVLVLSQSTPPDIQNSFMLSCKAIITPSGSCPNGWTGFKNSFANKNPNTMQIRDYDAYFAVFPIPSAIKGILLWSGLQDLAAQVSKKAAGRVTSSSTLTSSLIIDDMQTKRGVHTWCGKVGVPGGIDFVNPCPQFIPNTPVFTFWAALSQNLASSSDDVVFYLTPGRYSPNNFFGLYELPALLKTGSKAKLLAVLNVPGGNKCGEGQLRDLATAVRQGRPSLQYKCYDTDGSVDALVKIIKSYFP